MSDHSAIEWTDATWNPIRGTRGKWSCAKISEGCQNCYAERLNIRFGGPAYIVGADELRLDEKALNQPFRWHKVRRIFVCSMTDLFADEVPDEWIERLFQVMLETEHTYQVLTKRANRLARWVRGFLEPALKPSVLEHIWLGVSVENQARADERIPALVDTPAAVRFLSVEPLLGPIDLTPYLAQVDWVIVGGESEGPSKRRLVIRNPAWTQFSSASVVSWTATYEADRWVRSLRDQCLAAGVPLFFKQWGGPTPKAGGRLLDGRTWDEMPKVYGGDRQ